MISAKEGAIVAVPADWKAGERAQIRRQQKNYAGLFLYVYTFTVQSVAIVSYLRDGTNPARTILVMSTNTKTTTPTTGVDSTMARS
jgi:hypothetical protein